MTQFREVLQIIDPQFVIEGAGVKLMRSIAPHSSNMHDPFLLFDHFAFNDPIEGPIAGFPMHPHRGIETVTYMLEGSVNHRDSLGNSGLIGPGDVQWMTAGGGILHEEMPRRGPKGSIYGFQLWVNLPARLKMTRPRYQEIRSEAIPISEQNGATIRVISGKVSDVIGPVTDIAINPLYLDVTIQASTSWELPIPANHTMRAYIFEGNARFGVGKSPTDEAITAVKMVCFGPGGFLKVETGKDSHVRFMLMAGEQIREPIFPYGPFVMNSREEIQQALDDLRNGTFVRSY